MKKQTAKNFQDLIVWQKAHAFVLKVYSVSESLPKNEVFGLISQFKRAAVSIPANIAEGFKKKSIKDKARFFNIAQGSIEECRYYLILVHDLKYLDSSSLHLLLEEVSKLINAYVQCMVNSES